MSRRLRNACTVAFQRGVARRVKYLFEAQRALPVAEIPILGGVYSPNAPKDQIDALKRLVERALCARHLFEPQGWWLPLSVAACEKLINGTDREGQLVGQYGLELRKVGWDCERVAPFDEFCSSRDAAPGAENLTP